MPNAPFWKTLLASSTVTADATGATFTLPYPCSGFTALVKVGTVSGTSPTLNVYLQEGMRGSDGTFTWTDYASFKQLSTSTTEAWLHKEGSAGTEESHNASDGALTAEAIREGPLPNYWRYKIDVGGTSPSFATCEITMRFQPK